MSDEVIIEKKIIQTYDYDILMGLNHPDLSTLDVNLISFFNDLPVYPITKEIRFYYPNKFNIHFNKNRIRPKAIVSNDPEITKKLRSTLSKVSNQNVDKMTDKIKDLLTQQNDFDWQDISELFFEIIIENIIYVELFAGILKELEKKYSKLAHRIHHLILKQLYHPRKFNDTLSEPGEVKSKRWRVANGLLIVHLFNQERYSQKFLNLVLKLWLSETNPENLIPLEILVKIMPKLKGIFVEDWIQEKLTSLSRDKLYPSRLRLLLTLPPTRQRNKNLH